MQKISDSTSSANAEGEFTEGSAAAGVPATLITADWLNGIQRELLAILTKAGLSPDAGDFAQLSKAIFNSPALSGNPTAPTQDQFDKDTSLATTEFVQRALGNIQGVKTIAASQTLALADAGKLINIDTTAGSVTLTLPANAPEGTVYRFMKASSQANTATIVTSAQFIGQGTYKAGNSVSSIVLRQFDGLEVTSFGPASNWAANGGIAGTASLTSNGFERRPSGVIEQWGTSTSLGTNETRTVTLPIAYLSGVKSVVLTGDGANPAVRVAALGTTTFQLQNLGTAAQNVYWKTIGY